MAMDVRLAVDSVEYYVPFALPQGAKEAVVTIGRVAANAVCWRISLLLIHSIQRIRLLPS